MGPKYSVVWSVVSLPLSSILILWVWLMIGFFNCGLTMELDLVVVSPLFFDFSLVFDHFSGMFGFVVLVVSSCVMVYSPYYMGFVENYGSYCSLMKCFIFSMIVLIMVPNLLGMMVGWDGLGVSSFMLVVYYKNKMALSAGFLTFFSNRVGDACMVISICLLSKVCSYKMMDLLMEPQSLWVASAGLIVGSMTKSAQMPFSAWLPAAMAAPTPVSALVHSSTLVTAGCFVLIRLAGSIESGWYVLMTVLIGISSVYVSVNSVFEWDMKKVVALSTLGHMGLVMGAVSMGSVDVAFFHLMCHALCKSLLFLCVGVVIHEYGVQDLRHVGWVYLKLPLVTSFGSLSVMSLLGFPFLVGFYSKDLLVLTLLNDMSGVASFCISVVSFSSSVNYGCRLLSSFWFQGEMGVISASNCLKNSVVISWSVLGLATLFGGYFLSGCFVEELGPIISGSSKFEKLPILIMFSGVLFNLWMMYGHSVLNYEDENGGGFKKIGNYQMDAFKQFWYLPFFSQTLGMGMVNLGIYGMEKVEAGYVDYCIGGFGFLKAVNFVMEEYKVMASMDLGLSLVKGFMFVGCFSLFFFSIL